MKELADQSIRSHGASLTLSSHMPDSAHIRRNHAGLDPKGPTISTPNMVLTIYHVLKLFIYGSFNDTFRSRPHNAE